MNNFNYDELFKKYQTLLEENNRLKSRIRELEKASGSLKDRPAIDQKQDVVIEAHLIDSEKSPEKNHSESVVKPDAASCKSISQNYSKEDKIALFMSLFRGRSDVYARRWQNKRGKNGYNPVCLNEWIPDVFKSKICSD